MIYEYVVDPHWGWIGAQGNLVFLRNSKDDEGGRWINDEDYYLYSSQSTPHYTAMQMGSGSRITLGGAAQTDYRTTSLPNYIFEDPTNRAYSLLYYGYNNQSSVSVAEFTGSGEIDFASATGAGSINAGTGSNAKKDGPESPVIIVGNTVNTRQIGYFDPSAWEKTTSTIIKASQDISAYAIRSSGSFRILGDMSAQIFAYSSNANLVGYHDGTSNDATATIDISNNNSANAAGYRNASLLLENHFNGFLYSESNNFYTTHYNVANYNNNTIGAYGIWSSGRVQFKGHYNGAIHAEANNTGLSNYNIAGKQDSNKTANANNNSISAIGIQGTEIILGDFLPSALTGNNRGDSIHTEVKDTLIQAYSSGGDGSAATATGNTIRSIGISGSSLTINGVFEGTLSSEVSELRIDNTGGKTNAVGDNSLYLCGIYVTANLTANRNFAGDFDLSYSTVIPSTTYTSSPAALEANIYGIWAQSNLTVNGSIRSTINISVADNFHSYVYATEYVAGMRAKTLTASAYEGSITVTNTRNYTVAAGLIADKFSSGNDTTFDMSGDIAVSGSGYVIGILGGTSGAPLDLRVSGNITTSGSNTYSIFAGWYTSKGATTRYNNDDRVEVAAGAYIKGDIDLQNGQNVLIVDSNARVNGDVLSDLGKLNLEFVLNNQAFKNATSSAAATQAAILKAGSNQVLSSTCNVTLNLNTTDAGTSSYTIYQGNLGTAATSTDTATGWYARDINFKYQGITTAVIEKYGLSTPAGLDSDVFKVTSKGATGRITAGAAPLELKDANGTLFFKIEAVIVGNQVVVNVFMPDDTVAAQPLQILDDLKMQYDRENHTAKLSWNDADGTAGEMYEVEYRIVTNGVAGKSIVQSIAGSQKSVTLANIEANQNIEWRIRQNLGSGDSVSKWTTWGDHGETPTTKQDIITCSQPTDAKYFAEQSGASAVSVLQWKAGEYSEGLKYYVVQYFQSTVRLDEDKIEWDTIASVKKQVVNNELLLSGLNNTEYFYWRVQAVDVDNRISDWTVGEMFRVYNDDTTPPVFGETPSATVKYITTTDVLGDTETLDLILKWKAATDDRAGVSRYTVSWQKEGGAWTTIDISVVNENQTDYTFRLSDYADLVENGTYNWKLTASDYVGKTSKELTGTWEIDSLAPTFDTSKVEKSYLWSGGTQPITVSFAWDSAYDEVEGNLYYYQLRYRVTDASSWIVENMSAGTLSKTLTVNNEASYEYELCAFDKAGNKSSVSSGVWYGDKMAPTFNNTSAFSVTNNYNLSTQTNTLQFNWSSATDKAEGTAISGVKEFELSYYDKEGNKVKIGTYDKDTLHAIVTVGKGQQLSGLEDGRYTWSVTVYDNAGNSYKYDAGQFLIDKKAPSGKFNTPTISGRATYDTTTVDGGGSTLSGFGATPSDPIQITERVVTDAWVTFTFNGDFTDDSGNVLYEVQVSANSTFTANRTFNFSTDQQSLTLNSANGQGVGAVANNDLIYWRVRAVDTSGNYGAWYTCTPVSFIDEGTNRPTRVDDVVAPTNITDLTVSVVRDAGNMNTAYFDWAASYDLFGVRFYEFSYTVNGKSQTVQLDATESDYMQIFMANSTNGTYSWKVRAIDYVGNSSAWTTGSKFLIDTINPVLDLKSLKTISVQGSKDIGLSWAVATDANFSHYEIEMTSWNGEVSYIVTTDTSFWFLNQTSGLYSFRVRAVDAIGNMSGWSDSKQFLVTTTTDPGSSISTATSLPFANSQNHSVGGSDLADMFKITLNAAALVSITISDVENIAGRASGVKVNLLDKNGKRLKTLSLKNGTKSLDNLLLDINNGKDYYIQVVSGNNNSIEKYTITVNKQDFETPTNNVDWNSASKVTLNTSGAGSISDGWVGFGDATDYYKFTTTGAGAVTVNVSGLAEKMSVRVSLYSLVNGKYKKMANATVKAGTNNIFKKDVLALAGDYYIVVESGDKGKGKQNTSYDFTVNDKYFEAATPNNDWNSATKITLNTSGTGSFSDGWVGFGDAADYYKFTATGAGAVTVNVAGMDPNSTIRVSLYSLVDGKYKRVANATVKANTSNIFKKDVLALAGDYYIVVESGDKGKGKQNTSYDFTVNDKYFEAATPNNDWNSATKITLNTSGTGSFSDGWVGFGDAADYYKFTATGAGAVTVNVAGMDPNSTIRVSLYSLVDGKYKRVANATVKANTSNIFKKDVLALAGDYYIVVESGDKGKGKQNTSYDLSVKDSYFPVEAVSNNNFAQAETKTLSTTTNTSVNGWVGFGDAADYYKITAAGPGSFSFSVSAIEEKKTVKVSLYDLNEKRIKSWTVTDSKPLLVSDMLFTGGAYLVIESGDKGKGKQNTSYFTSIVYDAFPVGNTANNTQATATSVNFDSVGRANVSDWVGYGDNVDFFSFDLNAAGRVDLDLYNLTNALRIGNDIKVKLYNEAGKLLKLDKNLISSELEAGTYSVAVEIAKPDKYWTGYDLQISKLA